MTIVIASSTIMMTGTVYSHQFVILSVDGSCFRPGSGSSVHSDVTFSCLLIKTGSLQLLFSSTVLLILS